MRTVKPYIISKNYRNKRYRIIRNISVIVICLSIGVGFYEPIESYLIKFVTTLEKPKQVEGTVVSNPLPQNRSDLPSQSDQAPQATPIQPARPIVHPVHFNCGGPRAMNVGETIRCSLPESHSIYQVGLSVGCPDGETGNYTIMFDDGTSENMNASCGSVMTITPRVSKNMTLRMNSGGGGDRHISFTDYNSTGWSVDYYE